MARTERKRSEEVIRVSEERFRAMFELSPEAIVLLDKSGKIVIINRKVHDWLGYEPEEIIGKRISKLPFFTKTSLFKVLRHFKQRMQGRNIPPYELEFLDKKRRSVYGRLTANPIRDERGEITSILVVISNITERKRAEEALHKEKGFTESVVASLPGMFYLFDENGTMLRWNKNFERVSGYSGKELAEMNVFDFFTGEDKEIMEDRITEVFEKGESTAEAFFISKDGKRTPPFLHRAADTDRRCEVSRRDGNRHHRTQAGGGEDQG